MKNKVQKQVEKLFPHENAVMEADSWCSYAFTVGDNIVRVPKGKIGEYDREVKVLQFLKDKVSVQIPEVEVVHRDVNYAIHKKIKGNILDIEKCKTLLAEQQDLFCKDLAHFLAEMHSIPVKDVPKEFYAQEGEEYLTRERLFRTLKEDFSEKEIEQMLSWIEALNSYKNDDLVFLHKDFHAQNILIDENHRLKGVIDFGSSEINDRSLDFFRLYHFDSMVLWKQIVAHYEKIMNLKIDEERVALKRKTAFVCMVVYLNDKPELKKEMIKDYKMSVERLRMYLV
jgi:aminoglycoside phosphotransferase (APT) family kinase protein